MKVVNCYHADQVFDENMKILIQQKLSFIHVFILASCAGVVRLHKHLFMIIDKTCHFLYT